MMKNVRCYLCLLFLRQIVRGIHLRDVSLRKVRDCFIIYPRGFFDNKIEYEVIYRRGEKIKAQQKAPAVRKLGRELPGAGKRGHGKHRRARYEYYGEADAEAQGAAFAAGNSFAHQRIIAEQGKYKGAVLFAGDKQRRGGNQQPYRNAVQEAVLERHYRDQGEQRKQQGESAGKRACEPGQQRRPGSEKRQGGLVLR